jgi:hypothetical protein
VCACVCVCVGGVLVSGCVVAGEWADTCLLIAGRQLRQPEAARDPLSPSAICHLDWIVHCYPRWASRCGYAANRLTMGALRRGNARHCQCFGWPQPSLHAPRTLLLAPCSLHLAPDGVLPCRCTFPVLDLPDNGSTPAGARQRRVSTHGRLSRRPDRVGAHGQDHRLDYCSCCTHACRPQFLHGGD